MMMTIDRINEARRIAVRDPQAAEEMLLGLQDDLFLDSEKDAFQRAWRNVQEIKNPHFYGRR